MISSNPRLTERLILRIPKVSDALPLFHAYTQDPVVTKYLVWKPHSSPEVTARFVADLVRDWELGSGGAWVIAQKDSPDAPIGMISLRPQDSFKATMGYVLARAFWGRGYMPEAARAVIDLAFNELRLYRV